MVRGFKWMAWWWGIDKNRGREMEGMWVRGIERENTHERNEWTDLVVVDNEWVKDRGDRALSDCKENRNRVVEEDIRVVRTKGEILSNFTSRFHLTARLSQLCLNLLLLLLMIVPSCLVLVLLPMKRMVLLIFGLVRSEIAISATP